MKYRRQGAIYVHPRRDLRLGDFAGLDASGAYADAFVRCVDFGLYRLQVYVPAATGNIVRVRNIVAKLRLLAAKFTYLCHDQYPVLRMWMKSRDADRVFR